MSTASAVTTGDALGLAMVYRAINIHAISTKQMSLHVYRDDVKITEPSFVKNPDVNISRSAFMEQTVTAMACTGNAYWEITRDQAGRVMNLQNLNPLMVTIESNLAGQVTKYLYKDRELMPSKVKHLSLLRVPGGKYGLGPIQAAQAELRGAIDTRDYSSNWFSGSGVPSGILKSDQVLAPDQAVAAKEAWNATAGASNGVAVLGNGLTYTPIFLSPADAQFIDSQNFNVTQVARLFGIPASMLLAAVDGTSMTYTNIESEWISYIRFSLMSYLIEIEDALSSFLPRGQKAKFNIESLLRTDTKTRYESYKTALEAGFMTVEEIRKLEDLPTTGTVTTNDA
jgi:HK97 family phage portal protein